MGREHKPRAPKIERIELSEDHIKLRWVLVCILVAVAIGAILLGVFGSRQKSGWYTVESNSGGLHCGNDFILTYEYGAGEKSAAEEGKELKELYTALTENAWQLFYPEAGESQFGNLHLVNSHPNEEVTVDPALYAAFRLLEEQNSRLHYLGPVYVAYDQVFLTGDELLAADQDPTRDEVIRQYVLELAQFAADPNAIRLELRQENKVFLHISAEYKAYLDENMVETYVGFGWLRNAFVIDYIGEKLAEKGFTNCNITSVDGYTKNLDRRGNSYAMNLFDRYQGRVTQTATMNYDRPTSMVYLRTYDSPLVRTYGDGSYTTYMVDIADGQSKAALQTLMGYSETASCAEIALQLAPSFIAETFEAQQLNTLTVSGIYSIWYENQVLYYNQKDLRLTLQHESYRLSPVN